MSKDAIWLYHQDEAPEGRLFQKLDGKEAESLYGDGWVDTPAKFGEKVERRAKKSGDDGAEIKPIDKMTVAQLEDYIVQRGGVPEGSKADKVKIALSLPLEPAKTAPADMADAQDGDGVNGNEQPAVIPDADAPKPVDQMDEAELRAELEAAEVNVSASTGIDNLKSAVKALRGE